MGLGRINCLRVLFFSEDEINRMSFIFLIDSPLIFGDLVIIGFAP